MLTGNLQRRWSERRPPVYDKATRTVSLDIIQEARKDEDGNEAYGYSYLPVEIDRQIDYGHVKSQLIEAGFAQKDEFGLLMNAVDGIVRAVGVSDTWEAFRQNLGTEDVEAFTDFCAFRRMCGEAAREVMRAYDTRKPEAV